MKPSRIAQDAPAEKPALPVNREAGSDSRATVEPGKCLGCNNRDCAGCPITPESVRREVLEAVTPLVLALEQMTGHAWSSGRINLGRREQLEKLCGDVRAKWGEG